jgi:predicted nicotinamide N-methyase
MEKSFGSGCLLPACSNSREKRMVMKIGSNERARNAFILQNTRLTKSFLCPEIQLHLITDSCRLWYATEPDLECIGLEDPYWGFCWAGGQALARFILDHPEWVAGKRVLDFGAGCGIEAVAAGMVGADYLLASDIDPMAAAAVKLNARANSVTIETTLRDLVGDPLHHFDIVLAGDMFYDPAFARKVLSWFQFLGTRNIKVLLGDPSRGNLTEAPLEALTDYQAPADVDITGKYLQKTTVYTITQ